MTHDHRWDTLALTCPAIDPHLLPWTLEAEQRRVLIDSAYPYTLIDHFQLTDPELLARLQAMLDAGLIRRIGAVPNHYRLGFTANGMSVWDVADEVVDEFGERIGLLPGVSHCYRRPRRLPVWPYNLFAMLHGRSRDEVEQQAQEVAALLGGACRAHDILYSTAILKKTGLRLTES